MAVIKKQYQFTPPKIKEVVVVVEEEASTKEGIVTILRSDRETPSKSPSSIRRTLSVDMSSKKWLAQNGFSMTQTVIKKNTSSEVLALQTPNNYSSSSSSLSSSYEGDDEQNNESSLSQDDVWRSIQSRKEIKESKPIPIWGSILTTQKDGDNKPCSIPLPAPYVPPLMKRSSSFLSNKSLEICTESLGSETGSDDSFLSSYPYSESSYDADDYEEREKILTQEKFKGSNVYDNMRVSKYRNAPLRPIPPLIRSICTSGDSLHMQSRRENGRLVLEAVSVPPRNYFHARRGDGRLVLTLIHHLKATDRVSNEKQIAEFNEENNEQGGIEEEEDNECEVVKQELRSFLLPNKVISMHKSSLVMKTFISPGNKNPSTWFSNKKVEMNEEDERDLIQITPSLLPQPPRASSMILSKTQSSFDAYEYLWRNKTTAVSKRGFVNPVIANTKNEDLIKNNNNNMYPAKEYMNQDHIVVTTTTMRGGKLESFVPYLKSCKEAKRSLLMWEPYCVATS